LLARPLPVCKGLFTFNLYQDGRGFYSVIFSEKSNFIFRKDVKKMKQGKPTLEELMKRNKEELLRDKDLVERIEKRVEEKISKQ
jgi:hypothetical protein